MGRTPYTKFKRKLILDTLEKFPHTSMRAIARIVYKEGGLLFKDYEDARGMVRYYTGQSGIRSREAVAVRKYLRK